MSLHMRQETATKWLTPTHRDFLYHTGSNKLPRVAHMATFDSCSTGSARKAPSKRLCNGFPEYNVAMTLRWRHVGIPNCYGSLRGWRVLANVSQTSMLSNNWDDQSHCHEGVAVLVRALHAYQIDHLQSERNKQAPSPPLYIVSKLPLGRLRMRVRCRARLRSARIQRRLQASSAKFNLQ